MCYTIRQLRALRTLVSKSLHGHLKASELRDVERETGLEFPSGRTPSHRVLKEVRDIVDLQRAAHDSTVCIGAVELRLTPVLASTLVKLSADVIQTPDEVRNPNRFFFKLGSRRPLCLAPPRD